MTPFITESDINPTNPTSGLNSRQSGHICRIYAGCSACWVPSASDARIIRSGTAMTCYLSARRTGTSSNLSISPGKNRKARSSALSDGKDRMIPSYLRFANTTCPAFAYPKISISSIPSSRSVLVEAIIIHEQKGFSHRCN